MALVSMKKVRLIGLLDQREAMLRQLQRMDVVELREIPADDDLSRLGIGPMHCKQAAGLSQRVSNFAGCITFLRLHAKKKSGFLTPKPGITPEALLQTDERLEEAQTVVDQAKRMETEISGLRAERARLANQRQQMQPWVSLEIPLEDIVSSRHVGMHLGVLSDDLQPAMDALQAQAPTASLTAIGSSKEGSSVLLLVHMDEEAAALDAIRPLGFADAGLQGFFGTPKQILEGYDEKQERIDERMESVIQDATRLAEQLPLVEQSYDYLSVLSDRATAEEQLSKTQSTYVLCGWLREDRMQEMERAVEQVSGGAHVLEFEDPAEEDLIPTELDNPRIVQPFEVVTDLYSPPSARCIDPNPFMAPFYFLFFGMMVSDAAYGVFLAAACAIYGLYVKPTGTMKKLVWLLCLGGVSTLLWGILYGGYFGISLLPPVLFNPMEEPLLMLGLCFGLGLIHIIVGLGLKFYINVKRRHAVDAVCDQGLWILLLLGAVCLMGPMLGLPAVMGDIGLWVVLACAVGLVLTGGRHQKNVFKKFTSGLLSLYDITSYLSDVLSYSRLFALGLATGVIASVVNTIAEMAGGSIIGYIFMAVILVGGHIFNILINTLGAFVHASRLQYIEFYGKFYESGGVPFQPLGYRTRYMRVER